MNDGTWGRISRRQIWYKQEVLAGRLAALDKALDRINETEPLIDQLKELKQIMKASDDLSARLERHDLRMARGINKMLTRMPAAGTA
jgi:hypothetical protein